MRARDVLAHVLAIELQISRFSPRRRDHSACPASICRYQCSGRRHAYTCRRAVHMHRLDLWVRRRTAMWTVAACSRRVSDCRQL